MRPTADHPPYRPYPQGRLFALGPVRRGAARRPTACAGTRPTSRPSRTDFVDGLVTDAGQWRPGRPARASACTIYRANRSMADRVFYDADGELLIVPQQGGLRLRTELGLLESGRRRSRSSRAASASAWSCRRPARGYVAENYGALSACPTSARSAPTAWPTRATSRPPQPVRGPRGRFEVVQKFPGRSGSTTLDHSPARRCRLARQSRALQIRPQPFNTIGTVSFDHPDPSIFTVLTSPSDMPGRANATS